MSEPINYARCRLVGGAPMILVAAQLGILGEDKAHSATFFRFPVEGELPHRDSTSSVAEFAAAEGARPAWKSCSDRFLITPSTGNANFLARAWAEKTFGFRFRAFCFTFGCSVTQENFYECASVVFQLNLPGTDAHSRTRARGVPSCGDRNIRSGSGQAFGCRLARRVRVNGEPSYIDRSKLAGGHDCGLHSIGKSRDSRLESAQSCRVERIVWRAPGPRAVITTSFIAGL